MLFHVILNKQVYCTYTGLYQNNYLTFVVILICPEARDNGNELSRHGTPTVGLSHDPSICGKHQYVL